MKPRPIPALVLACVLCLGGLTACGGGSGDVTDSDSATAGEAAASAAASPEDATTAEFCAPLSDVEVRDGADVAALVGDMRGAGTPADVTKAQRAGFVAYVDALGAIDPETTRKELKQISDLGLSSEDESDVEAFLSYAAQTCDEG